jgi:hypothetical protein
MIAIYTQGKKGSISFPLKVEASSGIYHYRIYVDYPVSRKIKYIFLIIKHHFNLYVRS